MKPLKLKPQAPVTPVTVTEPVQAKPTGMRRLNIKGNPSVPVAFQKPVAPSTPPVVASKEPKATSVPIVKQMGPKPLLTADEWGQKNVGNGFDTLDIKGLVADLEKPPESVNELLRTRVEGPQPYDVTAAFVLDNHARKIGLANADEFKKAYQAKGWGDERDLYDFIGKASYKAKDATPEEAQRATAARRDVITTMAARRLQEKNQGQPVSDLFKPTDLAAKAIKRKEGDKILTAENVGKAALNLIPQYNVYHRVKAIKEAIESPSHAVQGTIVGKAGELAAKIVDREGTPEESPVDSVLKEHANDLGLPVDVMLKMAQDKNLDLKRVATLGYAGVTKPASIEAQRKTYAGFSRQGEPVEREVTVSKKDEGPVTPEKVVEAVDTERKQQADAAAKVMLDEGKPEYVKAEDVGLLGGDESKVDAFVPKDNVAADIALQAVSASLGTPLSDEAKARVRALMDEPGTPEERAKRMLEVVTEQNYRVEQARGSAEERKEAYATRYRAEEPRYEGETDEHFEDRIQAMAGQQTANEAHWSIPAIQSRYAMSGNTLPGGGAMNFVRDWERELRKREPKKEGESDEDWSKRLHYRAIRDLTLFKTAGLWNTPAVVDSELMGDNWDPTKPPSLIQSLSPRVEILGFGAAQRENGQRVEGALIYRQESPFATSLNLVDAAFMASMGDIMDDPKRALKYRLSATIPGAAITGVARAGIELSRGASLSEAAERGSESAYKAGVGQNLDFYNRIKVGMYERRNPITDTVYAMDRSEWWQKHMQELRDADHDRLIAAANLVALGGALVGTMVSPDAFSVGAHGLTKLAKIPTAAKARRAADMLDEVYKLRMSDSFEDWKRAEAIEKALSHEYNPVSDEFANVTRDVAVYNEALHPDTSRTDLLDNLVPDEDVTREGEQIKEIARRQLNLHQGLRKQEGAINVGPGTTQQATPRELLYDDAENLQQVNEALSRWSEEPPEGPESRQYDALVRTREAIKQNNRSRAMAARVLSEKIRQDYGVLAGRPVKLPTELEQEKNTLLKSVFLNRGGSPEAPKVYDFIVNHAREQGSTVTKEQIADAVHDSQRAEALFEKGKTRQAEELLARHSDILKVERGEGGKRVYSIDLGTDVRFHLRTPKDEALLAAARRAVDVRKAEATAELEKVYTRVRSPGSPMDAERVGGSYGDVAEAELRALEPLAWDNPADYAEQASDIIRRILPGDAYKAARQHWHKSVVGAITSIIKKNKNLIDEAMITLAAKEGKHQQALRTLLDDASKELGQLRVKATPDQVLDHILGNGEIDLTPVGGEVATAKKATDQAKKVLERAASKVKVLENTRPLGYVKDARALTLDEMVELQADLETIYQGGRKSSAVWTKPSKKARTLYKQMVDAGWSKEDAQATSVLADTLANAWAKMTNGSADAWKGWPVEVRKEEDVEGFVRGARGALMQEAEEQGVAPIFYSMLVKQVDHAFDLRNGKPIPANSLLAAVKKNVKQEELNWTGFEDWLVEKGSAPVTREEAAEFARQNQVRLEEVHKSDAARVEKEREYDAVDELGNAELRGKLGWEVDKATPNWDVYAIPGPKSNYRELIATWPGSRSAYSSPHWGSETIKNPLFHIRMTDRVDSAGRKVLFIDEVQSDWLQAAKKFQGQDRKLLDEWRSLRARQEQLLEVEIPNALKKYGENSAQDKALNVELQNIDEKLGDDRFSFIDLDGPEVEPVPPAPFVNTWHELAVKRILRYAAENGYDRVAFTPGEQIWKVVSGSPENKAGILNFYDKVIPDTLRKMGKRWGATPETVVIPASEWIPRVEDDIKVIPTPDGNGGFVAQGRDGRIWASEDTREEAEEVLRKLVLERKNDEYSSVSLPITTEMKRSVLYEGQALFQPGVSAKPRTATLFSGGGLVEEGLRGLIDPVYAVEANADIGAHYRRVHGDHVRVDDVRKVELPKEGEVDYLHASPVCKDYSKAKTITADGEQPIDIETATATAKAIDQAKPRVFTLENVAGYQGSEAMNLITDALDRNGYKWDARVYDAADYGAATHRKRLLLRAVKDGELPPVPVPTSGVMGTPQGDWYEKVKDLIDEMPDNFVPDWMRPRLEAAGVNPDAPGRPIIVMGGSAGRNVPFSFAGGPAPTIKATPHELHRIILPDGKVKAVTPRAMARITGLPDSYPLPDSRALATTIIGNGVPPDLTRAVFGPLMERGGDVLSQDPITSTAFRNWFGKSKVVDENGKPLRVFHGTGATFDEFQTRTPPERFDTGWHGEGAYFTENQELANYYTRSSLSNQGNPQVYPVYLKIENPYIWPGGKGHYGSRAFSYVGPEGLPEDIRDAVIKKSGVEWEPGEHVFANEPRISSAITDVLKEKGYDGVIVRISDGKSEFVAFDPEQIKSTFNRGTFSPTDPRILASYDLEVQKANYAGRQLPYDNMSFSATDEPTGARTWHVRISYDDGWDVVDKTLHVEDGQLEHVFGSRVSESMRDRIRKGEPAPSRAYSITPESGIASYIGTERVPTLANAMRYVEANESDEYIKRMARFIREQPPANIVQITVTKDKNYAGFYIPGMNTISLNHQASNSTLVHEAVHALTANAIQFPERMSEEGKKALGNLEQLQKLVKEQLGDYAISSEVSYGFTNLDEFVAEAFSNPKFQKALSTIPVEYVDGVYQIADEFVTPVKSVLKNAWDAFVSAVAKMLGTSDEEALGHVIANARVLMGERIGPGGAKALFQGGDKPKKIAPYVVYFSYLHDAAKKAIAEYRQAFKGKTLDRVEIAKILVNLDEMKGVSPQALERIYRDVSSMKAVPSDTNVLTVVRRAVAEQMIYDAGSATPSMLASVLNAGPGSGAIPEYLKPVLSFIMEQRKKLITGQVTPRDAAKAVVMTLASMRSSARPVEEVLSKATKAGFDELVQILLGNYPDKKNWRSVFQRGDFIEQGRTKQSFPLRAEIRPESFGAAWLLTTDGQRFLDDIEKAGEPSPQSIEAYKRFAQLKSDVYGNPTIMLSAVNPNPDAFTFYTIRDFTQAINDAEGDPALLDKAIDRFISIGAGKVGFYGHFLGFGNYPTMDARVIGAFLKGGPLSYKLPDQKVAEAIASLVEEKEDIQKVVRTEIEALYKETRDYIGADVPDAAVGEIIHHWLWDRLLDVETKHADLINVQKYAQPGIGSPLPRAAVSFPFQDQAKGILHALENPDVSSGIHEMFHIARRNLDASDMDKVVSWLRDVHKLEVGHENGLFTGSEDVIRQAEELFARGAERFIAEGKAPTPALQQVFEAMKRFVKEVYIRIAGSPLDVELDANIRAVYNKMLGIEPQEAVRIEHAQAGKSMRVPITNIRQANEAIDGEKILEEIAMHDEDPSIPPPTIPEIVAERYREVNRIIKSNASVLAKTALVGEQVLEGAFETVRGGARVGIHAIIGGIANKDLKHFPQKVQDFIRGVDNRLQLVTEEATKLAAEQDLNSLCRYLGGEKDIQFRNGGRYFKTAGNDAMAVLVRSYKMAFDDLTETQKQLVRMFASYYDEHGSMEGFTKFVNKEIAAGRVVGVSPEVVPLDDAAIVAPIYKLAGNAYKPSLMRNVFLAVGMDLLKPMDYTPGAVPFVIDLFRISDIVPVKGATGGFGMFRGTSTERAKFLINSIRKNFGVQGERGARAAGILIGTFGHVDSIVAEAAHLGYAVEPEVGEAFAKFMNGDKVGENLEDSIRVMRDQFGVNPQFSRVMWGSNELIDYVLRKKDASGASISLPKALKDRMATRLAEAQHKALDQNNATKELLSTLFSLWSSTMTRGWFYIKRAFNSRNHIDSFNLVFSEAGFVPAAYHTARLSTQYMLTAMPFATYAVNYIAKGAGKPDVVNRVHLALQALGDKIAAPMGIALSLGKYRLDTSEILKGSDKFLQIDGRIYRASDLTKKFTDAGLYRSFYTEATGVVQQPWKLENRTAFGRFMDAVNYHVEFNQELFEMWAESERTGAAVTLMEVLKLSPEDAAQLAIKCVYDYGGSMTKADRNIVLRICIPFWSFQKNANRQFIRNLFTPWGAYRLALSRKLYQYTPQALTELYYQAIADQYGIDQSRLSPEQLQWYMAVRRSVEEYYHGEVPDDVRRTMRQAFSGKYGPYLEQGRIQWMDPATAEAFQLYGWHPPTKEGKKVPVGQEDQSFYNAYVPRFDKTFLKTWQRDRDALGLAVTASDDIQKFDSVYGDDFREIAFLMPQSAQASAYSHIASLTALGFFTMHTLYTTGKDAWVTPDDGIGEPEVTPGVLFKKGYGAMQPIIDAERMPVFSDIDKVLSGQGAPTNVHPYLGKFLTTALSPSMISYQEPRTGPDGEVVGRGVYRIPAGASSVAFEYSGLGQINRDFWAAGVLTDLDSIPGAKDPAVAEAQKTNNAIKVFRIMEAITGFQVYGVGARGLGKAEEPTLESESQSMTGR